MMIRATNSPVMAGLVPAIHDLLAAEKAWMAVTSTAMTFNLIAKSCHAGRLLPSTLCVS
jgi:hypothetical protein